jgi:hypothetical protein
MEIFYENKKPSSTQISLDSYFKKPLPVKSGEKTLTPALPMNQNIPESSSASLSISLDFDERGCLDVVPSPYAFVQQTSLSTKQKVCNTKEFNLSNINF